MKSRLYTILICLSMGFGLVSCGPNVKQLEREIQEKQVELSDLRLEANIALGAGGLLTLVTGGADLGLGTAAGYAYAEQLEAQISQLESEIRDLQAQRRKLLYD